MGSFPETTMKKHPPSYLVGRSQREPASVFLSHSMSFIVEVVLSDITISSSSNGGEDVDLTLSLPTTVAQLLMKFLVLDKC